MPVTSPPEVALREFLGATTRHIRRVEIYEADGITRWSKDTEVRLKEGGVTVDYDRDERRALDLTLDNSDEFLVNAPGEFWYDKIIKVYRGVQVREASRLPKVLVLADSTTEPHAVEFRRALVELGFGDVRINTLASDYFVDVFPYEIIVALGGASKSALLAQAYGDGKSVFVFRGQSTFFYDAILGTNTWAGSTVSANATVTPRNVADPRTLGWSSFVADATSDTYKAPSVSLPDIFGVSFATGGSSHYTITSGENGVGGKFMAVHYPLTETQYADPQFRNFMLSAMNWLNPVITLDTWEVQIGEFMIDRISEPHRPRQVKITGRDYTKKCMGSKYTQATQFDAGQTLEALIAAIAGAAGITKRLLPATGIVIGRSFFFERGVTRWAAMKEIANAYNYEIFFDATGYLVIRPFRDPSTSAPVLYIQTGKTGQIASYTKSTSDAQLFNLIVVTGESSDSQRPPVYAIARNDNIMSPTRISKIGERATEFTSAFVETVEQAQELADAYLAVHSLEEFELTFDTLMLPWLEVGDIIGWTDPNPAPGDPDTFLLSNLSLPLTLSPMSGTGRRVTIVGEGESLPGLDENTSWNELPTGISWNQLPSGVSWNEI